MKTVAIYPIVACNDNGEEVLSGWKVNNYTFKKIKFKESYTLTLPVLIESDSAYLEARYSDTWTFHRKGTIYHEGCDCVGVKHQVTPCIVPCYINTRVGQAKLEKPGDCVKEYCPYCGKDTLVAIWTQKSIRSTIKPVLTTYKRK